MAAVARAMAAIVVCAALLASACRTPRATTSGPALRVMTYNIAAGGGDLARVTDVIRQSGADVVALQEVDVHWSERSGFADQARLLGERLGMQVRFAPIYDLPGADASKPRRQYGLALLSRFPVTRFHNHEITRLSTQQAAAAPAPMPGFLEAWLDVRGTAVRIFDTHLDYRADPAVRAVQTREMLALLGSSAVPALLMGDLNATPDARELAPLFAALRDAWTSTSDTGLTYPAAAPVKRIDYVLHSASWRATAVRVIASTASDHRPVVVDLVLASPTTR